MKKSVVFTMIALVVGCSGPSDPVLQKGLEALEIAYIVKVKPQDASFTRCEYRLVDNRHVVKCGISFGSPELAQVGYWEIDGSSGSAVAYAMNGKALSALEKIGESAEFKSGAGNRQSLRALRSMPDAPAARSSTPSRPGRACGSCG
mgnify:CR=1 FL=1